ncbi:MAG: ATP-binding protein [Alphaproteobacteria bacterium]|nr:ATP-binding protein [Alphaproteobacteria bacterium]
MSEETLLPVLTRIADALDRLAPPPLQAPDLSASDAFVWQTSPIRLEAVSSVNRLSLDLLQGIDLQKKQLLENTRRFSKGLPANNALLWGAKGTGKSSIVKAVHGHIVETDQVHLKLVEIHREDIPTLPQLLSLLKQSKHQCILFCDDLSFDAHDDAYKSLKAVLEGGVEGRPDNVLFYATSNRRHLMSRDMMENEKSTAINPSEAIEENVSLSDRFGLWLGFHNCDQETYFNMIEAYIQAFDLGIDESEWKPKAVEWTVTRGARSGRVAWQFIQDLAGELGKTLG